MGSPNTDIEDLLMIAIKRDCLKPAELQQVLAGQMAKDEFDSAISHLDNCDVCRSAADALQQEGRWIVESLGNDQPDPLHAETACQVALWRMLETPIAGPASIGTAVPCQKLGPYQLTQALGTGGMGTVYLAEHERLKRQCAIKLLPRERVDQPGWLERFDREMTTIAALEHPNVVRATDAGHQHGWHYLVMEYLDGLDVGRIASRMGQLEFVDACEIVRQAALGLAHVHNSGLVHRDVKPSNLMLTRSGTVKILDLGLVLAGDDPLGVDDRLTTVGHLMGTMPYMAPEQLADSHDVDPRADIYSLGATLYRLIAGRPPHQKHGGLAAQVLAITNEDPLPLDAIREDVDREIVQLVSEMLARDPAGRPKTAEQVAERLAPAGQKSQLKGLLREALRRRGDDEDNLSLLPSVSAGRSSPPSNRFRKWLAGGMSAAFLFLAAFVIKIQTDKGDLIVHSEHDGLTVLIKQGEEIVDRLSIESTGENRKVLRKGTYRVEIEGGGEPLRLSDEVVTISRGTATPLRVVEKQKAVQQAAPPRRLSGPTFRGQPLEHFLTAIETATDLDAIGEAMVGAVSLARNSSSENKAEVTRAIFNRAREYGGLHPKTPPPVNSVGAEITDSEHFMWYLHEIITEVEFEYAAEVINDELAGGNGRSRAAALYCFSLYGWVPVFEIQNEAAGRLLMSQLMRNAAGLVASKAAESWKELPETSRAEATELAYQLALRLAHVRGVDPLTIPPVAEFFSTRSLDQMSIDEHLLNYCQSGNQTSYDLLARQFDGNTRDQLSSVLGWVFYQAKQKHEASAATVADDGRANLPADVGTDVSVPTSKDSELLFEGNDLAHWMRLLSREQEPRSLGKVIQAVEVLTRDNDLREEAALATLRTARLWGGMSSSGPASNEGRVSSEDPSLQFMYYLLEVYPGYLPDPGISAIAEELNEGNARSRMAALWLTKNYLNHIYGDTVYSQGGPKKLLASQWIAKTSATPSGTRFLNEFLTSIQAAVDALEESGTGQQQMFAIETGIGAALKLRLMMGEPIKGQRWLQSEVEQRLAKAEQAWAQSKDKDDQAGQTAAGQIGTSAYWMSGRPTWIIGEDLLVAVAELADGREDANWAYLVAVLLDGRFYRQSDRCDTVIEILDRNAPGVLLQEIETKLRAFLIPGSADDHISSGGGQAMDFGFGASGFGAGGFGASGSGGISSWQPSFLLGRDDSVWSSALPLYAKRAKSVSDALQLLRQLRERLKTDKIEEHAGLPGLTQPLAAIDAAIKTLEERK